MAKSKKPDAADLSPVEIARRGGEDFLVFRDDGFTCDESEIGDVIAAMVFSVKNNQVKKKGSKAKILSGDDDVLIEDQERGDDPVETPKKAKLTPHLINVPATFHAIGKSIGTHSVKFASTRAKQHVLIFEGTPMMPFPDTKLSKIAKILFRPITVRGGSEPSCVFDEAWKVVNGQTPGPLLCAARNVIGNDHIDAFIDGLREVRAVNDLYFEGVPVVFLPAHDGSDMQITPLSPGSSYGDARRIFESYIVPHVKDKNGKIIKFNKRGSFSQQALTAQPQNISAMINEIGERSRMNSRVRMNAVFPDILRRNRAAIMGYVHREGQGSFPRMTDTFAIDVAPLLGRHAIALDGAGRRPELILSVRNMAAALADNVCDHVLDVIDEAQRIDPSFRPGEVSFGGVLFGSVSGAGESSEAARGGLRNAFATKVSRDVFDAAQARIDDAIESAQCRAVVKNKGDEA